MTVGILNIHFSIGFCRSLKEKRGLIKPVIHRLQDEFKFSVAEMDRLDSHKDCVISCAAISNDRAVLQGSFAKAIDYFSDHFPDLVIVDNSTEYF